MQSLVVSDLVRQAQVPRRTRLIDHVERRARERRRDSRHQIADAARTAAGCVTGADERHDVGAVLITERLHGIERSVATRCKLAQIARDIGRRFGERNFATVDEAKLRGDLAIRVRRIRVRYGERDEVLHRRGAANGGASGGRPHDEHIDLCGGIESGAPLSG